MKVKTSQDNVYFCVFYYEAHRRGKGAKGVVGEGGGGSQVPFSNLKFVQIPESHSTFASNPIPSGKDAWSNPSIACVQMFP